MRPSQPGGNLEERHSMGTHIGHPPQDMWGAMPGGPFGSQDVVSSDNVEQYTRLVSSQIARVEIGTSSRNRFQHQIARTSVGPLNFIYIRSDPLEIHRTARCIERDNQNEYLVGINLVGNAVVSHPHQRTVVDAESLFLLDKAIPYRSTHHDTTARLLVSVPRRLLESRLPDPSHFLSVTPSIRNGIGRLAAHQLGLLAQEGLLLNNHTRIQAIDMALDLVGLAFQGGETAPDPEGGAPPQSAAILLSRAKAYLRCNLDDPNMDPATVAKAMNISKRYLHKLFSTADTTFGTWVREERLTRANAMLVDPRFDHISITEIALRQGFNDIPHFSRQFRARYGYPPRMARTEAIRMTQ
ncbi:MAG: helix-turn-helix domain-containing protein [Alcaligenaceae bacterium]|nr:helix-turn-helix domain-containing protein [Alcaligenaceae bacterium SAGV5]MPS54035.1 helix-turn-helix domain-containing protein [Alcaligenaceae bacterium SAGV3]MPT58734.1 helix-turn-helix domain-containing protein [Alcaligenaceae bacterium]